MKDTTTSSRTLCLHLVSHVHITFGFKIKHNVYSQHTTCGLSTMQCKENNMNSQVRIFWPYHP